MHHVEQHAVNFLGQGVQSQQIWKISEYTKTGITVTNKYAK